MYSDQDGMQLIITPETDFEKEVVEKYGDSLGAVKLFRGSFSDCTGGWTRMYNSPDSLMIHLKGNNT